MDGLSHEQLQSYYETMPRLAAVHAGDGPFSLLDSNPLMYPSQLINFGYLPAYPPADRLINLEEAIEIASAFASNLADIAKEIHENNGDLIDSIERLKYEQGKTIVFVGDHDSFDNIVYPDMALALAESMRHKATDRPDSRTIIMAKQLGWYGLGTQSIVDMLRNYANIALTAPGTISGKETDDSTRKHINDLSIPYVHEDLRAGAKTITFAYAGQTNRKLINPITDEPALSVQYTPSTGSLELLQHPNVEVIPFATHRDETTKKMTFAYGEPRPIKANKSNDEARELGNEIAYLSWRISGVHTIQAIDKMQFDMLTASNPEPGHIRTLGKVVREFLSTNRERYHYNSKYGYYIVGSKDNLSTEKTN